MFRFNRFDKYRWNKKYPEGYADLCEFMWFYNGLSHNEDSILHRYINLVFIYKGQTKIGLLLVLNKNVL